MVDWQNPVIVLNDLGASVLGGPLFVVVYLSVCSFFFFPIFAVTGQVLRSNLYTSSTESICACLFFLFLAPDPLLLLPRLNVLLFFQNPCYCYQLGVRLQSRL